MVTMADFNSIAGAAEKDAQSNGGAPQIGKQQPLDTKTIGSAGAADLCPHCGQTPAQSDPLGAAPKASG